MRENSGRSLIEIIGVLAIGVSMSAAAYSMYKTIDARQKRLITYETVQDIAKKTKVLYAYSGYKDISANTLITDGAITDTKLPIGTLAISGTDANFTITISELTKDECEYFKIKKADWAAKTHINGVNNTACANNDNNSIAWGVE